MGVSLGTRMRTIAHLRWSQYFWRAYRYLQRRRSLTQQRAIHWCWKGMGVPPLRSDFPALRFPPDRNDVAALLERGVFHHLNESRELGKQDTDWCLGKVQRGRLWTITLHYHQWAYDLLCTGRTELFQHLVGDWIERCSLHQPGARDLAWNAYAIATRLDWWMQCWRKMEDHTSDFARLFLRSMWQQSAYLADHLEWDLRANHLLRDAVGLALAGRFFAGEEPTRWLAMATRLAADQAREQVLVDGGHFERSPMYHHHAMEDFHLLEQLVDDSVVKAQLSQTVGAMRTFQGWARHPDGGIALFNDAGLGEGNRDPLPQGGRWFEQTGLAVWHGLPWSVLMDVGAIGPDYQPGHAHADTLTLECSHRGHRLFVDPGTHSYDLDERRRYDRSTDSHNTVCIDGQDSSEVWHVFRVGRRARPVDTSVTITQSGMDVASSHDGYDHLPGRPRHTRRVQVHNGGSLRITDEITGGGGHLLQGGWLLAPPWQATPVEGGWLVTGPSRIRIRMEGSAGMISAIQTRAYHPEYGTEIMTQRLAWQVEGPLPIRVTTIVEEA